MSDLGFLGLRRALPGRENEHTEVVQPQRILHRILNFVGLTIDHVVNDPIAKNQVVGYYKLHRQIERACESVEMERAWNPKGIRY